MVNKQGQTRLAQYYEALPHVERRALEGEIVRKCLSRSDSQVRFGSQDIFWYDFDHMSGHVSHLHNVRMCGTCSNVRVLVNSHWSQDSPQFSILEDHNHTPFTRWWCVMMSIDNVTSRCSSWPSSVFNDFFRLYSSAMYCSAGSIPCAPNHRRHHDGLYRNICGSVFNLIESARFLQMQPVLVRTCWDYSGDIHPPTPNCTPIVHSLYNSWDSLIYKLRVSSIRLKTIRHLFKSG